MAVRLLLSLLVPFVARSVIWLAGCCQMGLSSSAANRGVVRLLLLGRHLLSTPLARSLSQLQGRLAEGGAALRQRSRVQQRWDNELSSSWQRPHQSAGERTT